MEDIKKIDLASPNTSPTSIPSTNMRKIPKNILIALAVIVILIAGSVPTILLPMQKTYSSALKTYQQGKQLWGSIKGQNINAASDDLKEVRKSLTETQGNLNSFSFTRFIPILGGYYNDADHLVKAGFYGLDAGEVVLDSIKPYADVLGLKGKGSFVMGSAEDRIRTAVMTIGKITPRIDDVSKSLELAKNEIDAVNPGRYPSFLGGGKIKNQLKAIQNMTDQGVVFVEEARPLIKVFPSLVGESKEKKYLILFQNNNELRPTGGFITAYAVFRIDKGIIHIDRSDDIYTLDKSLRTRTVPPDPILKYLPKVTTFNLRDSNLSPDFVESMKTFDSLYKNAADKTDVDGIIALDTSVLSSVIKILDDEVFADGIRFTSKKDKECDCPQAIWKLENLISKPKSLDLRITSLESVQAQRKDILGSLLYAIMQKALKSSPKLYWGPLVQELVNQTNQKHVLIYLYDKKAQVGVEALNAAGRIKSFEGDYLHINEANLGGAKSNLFVQEKIGQNIETESDGSIIKTITINYKNPFPPSDCNLERGNVCLNATLRDWIRVYVPKGSELISSQGSEVKVTSSTDLGKTVFDGFLTVRPLGTATYTLKYRLPFKLAKGSPLPILIQKQPGTDKNEYTTKINGREISKIQLDQDSEIKLSF